MLVAYALRASERLVLCPVLHLWQWAYKLHCSLGFVQSAATEFTHPFARVLLRLPHAEARVDTLDPSCAFVPGVVTHHTTLTHADPHGRHKNTPPGALVSLIRLSAQQLACPWLHTHAPAHLRLTRALCRQFIDRRGNRTPSTDPLRVSSAPPGRGLWLIMGSCLHYRHS